MLNTRSIATQTVPAPFAFGRITMILTMLFAMMLALMPTAFAASGQLRISHNQVGKEQRVEIGLNKSFVVELPVSAKEVIVSNPQVASAVVRTKRRAIIQGVGMGETNILFLDDRGTPIIVLDVTVQQSSKGLEGTIARLLPGSAIKVQTLNGKLVLSGTARSEDDMKKAVAIAGQFAEDNDTVASVISIDGAQQVMLKVTIAEVQRETVKQLGIDLSTTLSVGGLSTTLVTAPGLGGVSNVVAPNSVKSGFSLGNLSVEATVKALERRGAIRMLAEPVLTAISGAKAEFLAGGEFPVPTGYKDGEVTYTFKKFGVELAFTPTVHTGNDISMEVETNVSEINAEGGYTVGPVNIPATKERKASTSVRMRAGSTLAIAGLIEEKHRQRFNEVPGLGKIPILGTLFRSRDFIRAETELLVLVTPYLTEAGSAQDYTLPTDKFTMSDDAAAYFLGHMEEMYGVGGEKNGSLQGSIGFVLD
ncbi:type II and III secretion system protein family protein [uncultured Maritalea sp.]|jgi:pilus assembly protein CpaC|uniref:type II and III secretion system protein family protein n=1 Tax=uncultured Maritalea sp. TaxID=757249 RepID=UPI002625C59B|nr:type II and III secretion system protein family protein [uncultured Maritalea sp.]